VKKKRKVKRKKIEGDQAWSWSEAANRVADICEQYDSEDLPRIAIAALKQMEKRRKVADILSHLPRLKQFKQMLDQIHARRDQRYL
jgi:N-acetyl-beta-hexosaminidase